jgi:hypothetical protein
VPVGIVAVGAYIFLYHSKNDTKEKGKKQNSKIFYFARNKSWIELD